MEDGLLSQLGAGSGEVHTKCTSRSLRLSTSLITGGERLSSEVTILGGYGRKEFADWSVEGPSVIVIGSYEERHTKCPLVLRVNGSGTSSSIEGCSLCRLQPSNIRLGISSKKFPS